VRSALVLNCARERGFQGQRTSAPASGCSHSRRCDSDLESTAGRRARASSRGELWFSSPCGSGGRLMKPSSKGGLCRRCCLPLAAS